MITKYKIVKAENIEELERIVTTHIQMSWQPFGHLTIQYNFDHSTLGFLQPMVFIS